VGIPLGHYKTITLVAGLRLSGLVALWTTRWIVALRSQ
jgi:hypothetical protein